MKGHCEPESLAPVRKLTDPCRDGIALKFRTFRFEPESLTPGSQAHRPLPRREGVWFQQHSGAAAQSELCQAESGELANPQGPRADRTPNQNVLLTRDSRSPK